MKCPKCGSENGVNHAPSFYIPSLPELKDGRFQSDITYVSIYTICIGCDAEFDTLCELGNVVEQVIVVGGDNAK